jgi:DNA-binding response OmpR family regulator
MTRVLIVDDREESRESLRVLCELWGHQAATAADRDGALAMAEVFRPDVVVLDLGLPAITDGFETARSLRKMSGDHAYIVALSGWTRREDHAQAIKAGCDVYFLKPFDPRSLREIVTRAAEQAFGRMSRR